MSKRFRRLRLNESLKTMVRERTPSINDFIYPFFVVNDKGVKKEISSMPDVFQMSLDETLKECRIINELGIKAITLFDVLKNDRKDSCGSDAVDDGGLTVRSIGEIKKEFPNLFVISDLCFCEYTDHGRCRIINPKAKSIDNDATLEISAKQALVHARAGVNTIAPSGMMDGIIETSRKALDEEGFENLPIMACSTKFASSYYGPSRDVTDSTPSYGDRKSYQTDFANGKEVLEESLEDEAQGADILMVKPALAYLDVVKEISLHFNLPLCVYNVSGEYAMLKAAGRAGVINYEKVLYETMIAFKGAGAKLIVTCHAKELAKMLKGEK